MDINYNIVETFQSGIQKPHSGYIIITHLWNEALFNNKMDSAVLYT